MKSLADSLVWGRVDAEPAAVRSGCATGWWLEEWCMTILSIVALVAVIAIVIALWRIKRPPPPPPVSW